jgi:hypothetical protein
MVVGAKTSPPGDAFLPKIGIFSGILRGNGSTFPIIIEGARVDR